MRSFWTSMFWPGQMGPRQAKHTLPSWCDPGHSTQESVSTRFALTTTEGGRLLWVGLEGPPALASDLLPLIPYPFLWSLCLIFSFFMFQAPFLHPVLLTTCFLPTKRFQSVQPPLRSITKPHLPVARSLSLKHPKNPKLSKTTFQPKCGIYRSCYVGTCQDYLSRAIWFSKGTETPLVFLSIAIANVSLPWFWQSINKNTELSRNLLAWRCFRCNCVLSLAGREEFDNLALEQISKWGPFVTHLLTVAFVSICEVSSFTKYQTTICGFWNQWHLVALNYRKV